jgi:uncharacterized protein HemX
MSEPNVSDENPSAPPPAAPAPAAAAAAGSPAGGYVPPPAAPGAGGARRGTAGLWLAVLGLLVLVGLVAWWLNQRLYATQAEIAQRLQQAQTHSIEARTIATQNVQATRDLAAKIAVLQSREQDLAAQRTALQQLVQDLAKTRDNAFLGQTAQLIALAQQQAELTGTLQPLIVTLQSSLQRLQRVDSPRAALVAHAVQSDLARLKAAVVPDVPVAAQRLDQLAAMIDQLQVLGSAAPLEGASAPAPAASHPEAKGWREWLRRLGGDAWRQARGLVTVTRVDQPEALLASPSQDAFLRANLKLRVLNARLDLLSRNAFGFKVDMQDVERVLRTQFNPRQARTQMARALAAQIAQVDLTAQPAANLQSLLVLANLGLGGD